MYPKYIRQVIKRTGACKRQTKDKRLNIKLAKISQKQKEHVTLQELALNQCADPSILSEKINKLVIQTKSKLIALMRNNKYPTCSVPLKATTNLFRTESRQIATCSFLHLSEP